MSKRPSAKSKPDLFVGADPSMYGCGLAVVGEAVITRALHHSGPLVDSVLWLRRIAEEFEQVNGRPPRVLVAIERVSSRNSRFIAHRAAAATIEREIKAAFKLGKPKTVFVDPGTWRAAILGVKQKDKLGREKLKEMAMWYAKTVLNRHVETDDEAEALCLAVYAQRVLALGA